MKLLKRTYALPPDALEKFEQAVDAGKRSAVIAELIREYLAEREREALRRDIIEGCEDMAEIYLEMEREWHPLEEEVARAFEP
jgi:metal-responsive CopG/Arc/MetJ family transcriptional regulator